MDFNSFLGTFGKKVKGEWKIRHLKIEDLIENHNQTITLDEVNSSLFAP